MRNLADGRGNEMEKKLATSRQLWALFCGTKCKTKGLSISKDKASDLIDAMNNGEAARIRAVLIDEYGCDTAGDLPVSKAEREAKHQAVWDKAWAAGVKAAEAATPVPMHIPGYAPITEGVCGFAWVEIHPATSSFAKWVKAHDLGKTSSYAGGVHVWIGDYDQSMTRKKAHAIAMGRVIREELDINAYGASRID